MSTRKSPAPSKTDKGGLRPQVVTKPEAAHTLKVTTTDGEHFHAECVTHTQCDAGYSFNRGDEGTGPTVIHWG